MAKQERGIATCLQCGFESSDGGEAWTSADHPTLGSVTRCPECGSTEVHSRG